MLIGQLALMLVACAVILLVYKFVITKQTEKQYIRYFKILSLVLAGAFFFRYMLGQDALQYVFNFNYSPLNAGLTLVSLIVNWLVYSAIILIALYPFFKTEKITALVKYYCLIVGVLYAVFIYPATMGIEGASSYTEFSFRTLLMGLEAGILLGYSFVVFISNNAFKITREEAKAFWYVPAIIISAMPVYTLKAIFGQANYAIKILDLTFPHRIILYLSVLLPVAIYFALRKKDAKTIRFALTYISLTTLMTFSIAHKFASFTNVAGLPIHLCNTAMYIIPLVLIFDMKKLFYFTYLINVLGAFLAMAMPNYSATANLFDASVVRFYVNHYIAFFMPIIMVSLKVYKRPRLKEFKYSMVGFGIYFTLALVLNAWFSNYASVDYFFLNSDFIADKLGKWAEDLRNIIWQFNIKDLQFTFYPLYQFLFFLTYVALGAGVWFLYEASYTFADTLVDITKRKEVVKADKLALEVALAGRSKEEPMNPEGTNKIILRNFSKRYAKSKVYAVKDANLEINGGEIFGFLGHNGAGKSTIIKSIVGIQPITSGSIEVCGYDVDKQPIMAKRNIGFVPDHYALYEKLTGREYINYIADLYEVSQEERNQQIEKYITLFELTTSFDNPIQTYSHGMKQKIAIIAALIHNPKVWILDEPLTGLDPNSIYQVKECMKAHAKAGNIVFFSSHIIDVVQQICDKIAIIKKGQILTSRYVDDIEKECSLEEFYLKTNQTAVENAAEKEEKKEKQNKKQKLQKQ
ncbi:MAG: ATP-binding cassette domain-containing protein [Christensenellales bacterium]